jgi:hypothetical protein
VEEVLETGGGPAAVVNSTYSGLPTAKMSTFVDNGEVVMSSREAGGASRAAQ